MKWELGAFFLLFMSKAVTINYFYFSIYNFLVFDLLFVLHNSNTLFGLKDFTIFKRIFSSKKFNLIFFCFLTEKVISMKTKLQMQQSP